MFRKTEICAQCGKPFKGVGNLNKHMKNIHGVTRNNQREGSKKDQTGNPNYNYQIFMTIDLHCRLLIVITNIGIITVPINVNHTSANVAQTQRPRRNTNRQKSYKFDFENQSDDDLTAIAIQESPKLISSEPKVEKRIASKRSKTVSKKLTPVNSIQSSGANRG